MNKLPRLLSLGLLLTSGCGPSTSPSPPTVTATFTGVWQAQYRVTDCSGDRHCGLFIGGMRSFVLRVQQTGTSVTGVLVIRQVPTDNAYYQGDLTVTVDGSVAADGTLTLTGFKPAASSLDTSGDVKVDRLALRLSQTTGLAGTLAYESRYAVSQNPETPFTTRAGEITTATRTELAPVDGQSPLQGHWSGRAVIRTCTADVPDSCVSEPFTPFDLTLMQSGNLVTGILDNLIPVSGSASSQMLTLQGSVPPQEVSGGFGTRRVTNWATTVDGFGRMQGSYTYIGDLTRTADGKVFTTTIVYDLVSVVLMP